LAYRSGVPADRRISPKIASYGFLPKAATLVLKPARARECRGRAASAARVSAAFPATACRRRA